jgi:hypothetical protein
MWRCIFIIIAAVVTSIHCFCAMQNNDGPALPVILDHADSIVGTGEFTTGIRQFLGNVRFRQGNVTVQCKRAVQYVGNNRAELFGNVVITQDNLVLRAPQATYDGSLFEARMMGGVIAAQGSQSIRSGQLSYSTFTHLARFDTDVFLKGDSLQVWADTVEYHRDSGWIHAWSRVFVRDSLQSVSAEADSAVSARGSGAFTLYGVHNPVALWQIQQRNEQYDTTYVSAQMLLRDTTSQTFVAAGTASLSNRQVQCAADTIVRKQQGIELKGAPILWSDSMQLTGKLVVIDAPNNKVNTIVANDQAVMISRTDTARLDRFDQIIGDTIVLDFQRDTIRQLRAFASAQSVTWQQTDERGDGVAHFVADSIITLFEQGDPVEVLWLGTVNGERVPEPIASRRVEDFILKGVYWNALRPKPKPLSQPFDRPKFPLQ